MIQHTFDARVNKSHCHLIIYSALFARENEIYSFARSVIMNGIATRMAQIRNIERIYSRARVEFFMTAVRNAAEKETEAIIDANDVLLGVM